MPDGTDSSARGRLLKAGAQVYAERGYAGGSVREICKRAETSPNMVHHYFGSKAGLLEAIVERFDTQVLALPMCLLDTPARSKDDFDSRMEMLFEATLDAFIARREVVMVVLREQADPPALREYTSRFVRFLDQGKRKGFVRRGLDTRMVTGAMLDRISSQVQFAPLIKRTFGGDLADPKYKKRWCASNIALFLHGIVG